MSEKLLPCPLCGGCPVLTEAMTEHWVSCGTCGASGGMHGRLKLAVEAWNRRTPAPEGEACPTCNGVRPEFCSNAFHLASPVVPAPEGEVVAWRYRAKNRPHDNWRLADYDMAADWPNLVAEPLYASPVVPVGVSEVLDAAAAYLKDTYGASYGLDHPVDRARILAALRPTDTGWRDIATAPKDGQSILAICGTAYSPLAGVTWWQEGWTHYSRPAEKWHGGVGKWFPTHWMPLPPAPTDTGRE